MCFSIELLREIFNKHNMAKTDRLEVKHLLEQLTKRNVKSADDLLRLYDKIENNEKAAAIIIFGELRFRPSIPLLLKEFHRDEATGPVSWALSQLGGDLIAEHLLDSFTDKPGRNQAIVSLLGTIGNISEPMQKRIVSFLTDVLSSKEHDNFLRSVAADSLANPNKTLDSRAISALGSLLEDPSSEVRACCANTLGEIRKLKYVMPYVQRLKWMADNDYEIAEGLGPVCDTAKSALERIFEDK